MKKLLCCILMLLMLLPAATAEQAGSVNVTFEDGFTLSLPADWVRFEVAPELQPDGYIYCLGSADGAQLMYVQRWKTQLSTIDELSASLEEREEIELRTVNTSASGEPFLMYSFIGGDASGGMLLLNGSILNLLFTPQSDHALMLTAATILTSFSAE